MTDQPTLVFLDTETTSLRPDRRAWDIAAIVREPGRADQEYTWLVQADDLDLGNADLSSLKIGHFYQRHPDFVIHGDDEPPAIAGALSGLHSEGQALEMVEVLTRGAHLVGCVPNFDAEVLGARMRAHGMLPGWHYHLIDCETLAAGYLRGAGLVPPGLPWDSEALSRALGVQPPGEADRHTALGDARWARDLYDAVTGPAVVVRPPADRPELDDAVRRAVADPVSFGRYLDEVKDAEQ